jgi:hypothetical protein
MIYESICILNQIQYSYGAQNTVKMLRSTVGKVGPFGQFRVGLLGETKLDFWAN